MKPAIRIGISASLKSLVFFFFTYSTPCSLLSCEKEKEKKKKRRVLGRLVLLVEHLFSSFHLGWFLRFFSFFFFRAASAYTRFAMHRTLPFNNTYFSIPDIALFSPFLFFSLLLFF